MDIRARRIKKIVGPPLGVTGGPFFFRHLSRASDSPKQSVSLLCHFPKALPARFIRAGSDTPQLASAWLGVGAALRRDSGNHRGVKPLLQ